MDTTGLILTSPPGLQWKGKVLLVDDQLRNLQVLRNTLLRARYDTRLVTSAAAAYEAIQEDPPDLILLDIMMPGEDGFAFCSRLQRDPRFSEIPVVFVTAKTAVEDVAHGLSIGAKDFIVKPIKPQEVVARVATHLGNARFRQAMRTEMALRDAELRRLARFFSDTAGDLAKPSGSPAAAADIVEAQAIVAGTREREATLARLVSIEAEAMRETRPTFRYHLDDPTSGQAVRTHPAALALAVRHLLVLAGPNPEEELAANIRVESAGERLNLKFTFSLPQGRPNDPTVDNGHRRHLIGQLFEVAGATVEPGGATGGISREGVEVSFPV